MMNDYSVTASTLNNGPSIPIEAPCEEPIREILIQAYKVAFDTVQCLDAIGDATVEHGEPSRLPELHEACVKETALALRETMLGMNTQIKRLWDVIGHA